MGAQLLASPAALRAALAADPGLATARPDGARTLLHMLADYPAHRAGAAEMVALLVAAGADVDAPFLGEHAETALHWAASADDVALLDALLDAGADLEARGGVIGGGTALDDAWAFGQWRAARRLLERGAQPSFLAACALGLPVPDEGDLDAGLWAAAHGGAVENARALLARGADPAWVGWDELTAEGAARRSGFVELAEWLRSVT